MKPVDIRLLVFGGTDEVTGVASCEDASTKAFSVQRNKKSWEIVGAAPLVMKCSESDKVQIDGTDPNFSNHETVEAAGHDAASHHQQRDLKVS